MSADKANCNTVLLFAQSRACADAARSILGALFPNGIIKTKYYEAAFKLVDVCFGDAGTADIAAGVST